MILNKNNMPLYATGTKYSDSTLKSMTKDELIEYLCTAQFNYESINERLSSIMHYAKTLDKALDRACYELECADEAIKDLRTKVNDIYFGVNTKTEWRNQLIRDSEVELQ